MSNQLMSQCCYEIIPLKSADAAIEALPAQSHTSATCSVAKGIGATLELSGKIARAGHSVTPHIAARMVESHDHLKQITSFCAEAGIKELFIVGGDQPDPLGPYSDGLAMARALLEIEHPFATIGFPAYPDGHASIDTTVLNKVLVDKTSLVKDAGLACFISTQMCFDSEGIVSWLRAQRAAGVSADMRLGVPGVIDKIKLMTLGARLGIGSSLRFLKKNRSTMSKLLSVSSYDPSSLVDDLLPVASELGIAGLHLFTFNEVAATRKWVESAV